MGLGRDIRVDPEEDLRLQSQSLSGPRQMLQLLARVHGHAHARPQSRLVIQLALGVAVEEDLVPGDADHADDGELSGREDVCSHALLGGNTQDCEVAVGLYCEVLVSIRKCPVVGANVLAQSLFGCDIKGRAVLLRQSKAVHVFDKEVIVASGEMRFRSEHDFN